MMTSVVGENEKKARTPMLKFLIGFIFGAWLGGVVVGVMILERRK